MTRSESECSEPPEDIESEAELDGFSGRGEFEDYSDDEDEGTEET